MKTGELLEVHPLTTEVIRTWFFDKMVASFADESVPEEFKEMMKQEGVTNERLAKLIDVQPRTLFDVFDENGIIIYFMIFSSPEGVKFSGAIHIGHDEIKPNPIGKQCNTRKEAELFAIEKAFEILENLLTPSLVEEIEVIDNEIVTSKEETDETDN